MKLNGIEFNKIYCMDCIELMQQLPDECIDLVIADPPYFADKSFVTGIDKYNRLDLRTKESYLDWSCVWLEEACRLLNDKGSLYLFAGNIIWSLYSILEKKLIYRNAISWIKKNRLVSVPQLKNWFPKTEIILFFTKSDKYIWNPIVKKYGIMESSNFQIIPNIMRNMKEGVDHPSQKPLKLICKFIEASSKENSLVLDPFLGSGTTAVAARKLNRNFLGCDSDPNSVKIAEERLSRL